MTTTLEFPGFKKERFNTEVVLDQPDGAAGYTASTRLSPFQMPAGVKVQVNADGDCRFLFSYLNEEPTEKELRELPGDEGVFVRIGRHSGKIVEVLFRDVITRLESERVTFNPAVSVAWCQRLTGHHQFACSLNASVVADILKQTPVSLRRDIQSAIRRIARRSGGATE